MKNMAFLLYGVTIECQEYVTRLSCYARILWIKPESWDSHTTFDRDNCPVCDGISDVYVMLEEIHVLNADRYIP